MINDRRSTGGSFRVTCVVSERKTTKTELEDNYRKTWIWEPAVQGNVIQHNLIMTPSACYKCNMYGIAMFCCFFPLLTCLHHVLSWCLLRRVSSLGLWQHDSVTPTACPSGCRTTTSSGTELVAKVQALGGCHHQIRWGAALHFADHRSWKVQVDLCCWYPLNWKVFNEWCWIEVDICKKKYPSYLIPRMKKSG